MRRRRHVRKEKPVFAVWDGSAYRYPRFQFDNAGRPPPYTPALIQLLPRQLNGSNRDAALWLYALDALIEGKTPADVFPEDPELVLRIARRKRGIDPRCAIAQYVFLADQPAVDQSPGRNFACCDTRSSTSRIYGLSPLAMRSGTTATPTHQIDLLLPDPTNCRSAEDHTYLRAYRRW